MPRPLGLRNSGRLRLGLCGGNAVKEYINYADLSVKLNELVRLGFLTPAVVHHGLAATVRSVGSTCPPRPTHRIPTLREGTATLRQSMPQAVRNKPGSQELDRRPRDDLTGNRPFASRSRWFGCASPTQPGYVDGSGCRVEKSEGDA